MLPKNNWIIFQFQFGLLIYLF